MPAVNDLSQLNANFKTVYAERILELIPDFAILQKKVSFSGVESKLGDHFEVPVALSNEGGFTYMGENDAYTGTDLNAAVAGSMQPAKVKGSALLLRAQLSYVALSRSQGDLGSFKRASAWKVDDMNKSTRKRLDIGMLYGQTSLGALASDPGTGTTSYTLTISDASFAPGIWVGSEGHQIDLFNAAKSTARNTGTVTISAVDTDAKTLTVTTSVSGDLDGLIAGDVICFKGSVVAGGTPTYNEMAGLDKIITNASTLFNINAATYSLWKGNTVSSVGLLTFAKINDAVQKAVNKGLLEKATVLLSPKAWAVLNTNEAALRRYDAKYSSSKASNGAEALEFHSTNGVIEVLSHPFVKEGEAFIVPMESVMRVGSTDLSFGVPGMSEQFFTLVPNRPVVELQCLADQAIFVERPAHCVKLSGITFA